MTPGDQQQHIAHPTGLCLSGILKRHGCAKIHDKVRGCIFSARAGEAAMGVCRRSPNQVSNAFIARAGEAAMGVRMLLDEVCGCVNDKP